MIRLPVLVNHIRTNQTRSAMNGGCDRDNHFLYPQLRCISARMYRPSAPEGEKNKVPRIVPLLYGCFPDQVAHVRIRYSKDAASRFDLVHAERLGDLLTNRLNRRLFIQPHSSA